MDPDIAKDIEVLRQLAEQMGIMCVSQKEFRNNLTPFCVTYPGTTTIDPYHVGEFCRHERRLSNKFKEFYERLLYFAMVGHLDMALFYVGAVALHLAWVFLNLCQGIVYFRLGPLTFG